MTEEDGSSDKLQSSALANELHSAAAEDSDADLAEDSEDETEVESDDEEYDDDMPFVGLSEEELMRQDALYAQDILTDEELSRDSAEHRTGYVALIGKPNAGKSTLLNSLLGQKLSAVTRKAQTTRHRILGILSGDDYQMILLDTPGIIKDMRTKLDEKMMHNVRTAVQDADALLVIIDATEDPAEALAMVNVGPDWQGPPLALVLNKVDLLRGNELQRLTEWLLKNSGARAVIPTSATQGRGVLDVRDWASAQLPLGPTLYPKDVVAEQPERFFVAEIVREKILLQYYQEIPYATAVSVTDFKERANGKDYIQIVISVEEESQKPIILGRKGSALKQLATTARIDIEEFLGRQVYLDVTVKVMEKWRKNEKMLEQYGY